MKNTKISTWSTRLLAVVLMATLVVSCGKKDDPTPANAVVGNWKLAGLLVKEDNGPEEDFFPFLVLFGGTCFTDLVFSFNANGTLSTNNPASCKDVNESIEEEGVITSGKWSVNGAKITMIDTDGVKDEYDYTIAGDMLSMVQTVTETDPATKKPVTTKTTLKFKKA
ncbi:MAG: hypothetical protein EAZ70_04510 [Runella slithyformis]|nr:MAG: hypothetical protein EAY79_03860 [Runella slithyformis]TAF28771.1 MAG: hypothetical protein EAZ70_04510 [Runella slithyformis]TAF47795.1 MAG: hypothetical protein EAZ63_06825 [Runella slithyformis]TAF82738.1 MAG: hypothetical protein EAZ50_03030 [Runella slithyformis]